MTGNWSIDRRLTLTFATLLIALAWVSSAHAQAMLPPCGSDTVETYADDVLGAPAKAAIGRTFDVGIVSRGSSLDDGYTTPETIYEPAFLTMTGPGGAPIADGFVDQPFANLSNTFPVTFTGPIPETAALTLRIVQHDYTARADCQRTFTASVESVVGDRPRIARTYKYGDEAVGETTRAALHVGPTGEGCPASAEVGTVDVNVALGRERVRLRLDDQCGHVWKRTGSTHLHGWEVETDGRSVYIGLTRTRTERRRITYSVMTKRTTLRHGHIRAQTDYAAPHTIWEGSDAFVNYCINRLKEIRSEDGRLYCVYDGYVKRYYDFTT